MSNVWQLQTHVAQPPDSVTARKFTYSRLNQVSGAPNVYGAADILHCPVRGKQPIESSTRRYERALGHRGPHEDGWNYGVPSRQQ